VNAPVHQRKLTAESTNRQDRRPVQLSGHAIIDGTQTIEVQVVNLTYDGCCISAPIRLKPAQALKLSVSGLGVVDAQVRWWEDGKVGLQFGPGVEEEDTKPQPRAAERIAVTAEVLQRRQGQPGYRVRLFDVSRNGCKAEFVERPRAGDHVWIKFEGLESIDAEICWAEGFQAGLKYVNPIHPAVFDLLLKRFSTRQ
jgi:hypothetical protein